MRELLGHTGRALTTVVDYLGAEGTVEVATAAEYFRLARTADPAAISARGKAAGAELGDDPVANLRQITERATRSVQDAADDELVGSPFGVMMLAEYLPTRTFELVVHTCDLAAATGRPLAPPAAPAASAMRLAAALAGPRAGEVLLALTGRGPLASGFSVLSDPSAPTAS
ncbi:maleylpyruvate isomerase N-terminal domain-containing protein [soil metagenome]